MAEGEPPQVPIEKPKPIIIVKKSGGGHGGHHGGAWKVAYADFVTAMMSLFIVLWLMGADDEVKKAIASYFNDPTGQGKMAGSKTAGTGNSIQLAKDDMGKLQEKLQKAMEVLPNFKDLKDHVEMSITPDGLRIELLETEAGMFFDSGKPVPNDQGAALLHTLADQLGKLPNHVLIEGHTDSKPYSGTGTYSNWELSAERANAARKIMEASGLWPLQVAQVRGFADRQLRHPEDPESPANRRISVIVQYMEKPSETKTAESNTADPKTAESKTAESKTAGSAPPKKDK
jgi:chemotaxis protein MotB